MSDLPKGHWIHAAMAKEKARVGKKKKPAGNAPAIGAAQAESSPEGSKLPGIC